MCSIKNSVIIFAFVVSSIFFFLLGRVVCWKKFETHSFFLFLEVISKQKRVRYLDIINNENMNFALWKRRHVRYGSCKMNTRFGEGGAPTATWSAFVSQVSQAASLISSKKIFFIFDDEWKARTRSGNVLYLKFRFVKICCGKLGFSFPPFFLLHSRVCV